MIPIKEDGSLDVERINTLKLDEYLVVLRSLNKCQLEDYFSKIPINESYEPMKAIRVDFGLDDKRSGVDMDEYIDKKKKKYGII